MDGLVVCFEQDEQFFGAGGNRRGTQEDDGLRESYFATRLSLLSRLAAARPPEYVAARAVLLRRSFSRRKPNREVLALALQQKQQARTASAPPPVVAAAAAPVKPKLFKVVDEYAFTGIHCLFDHHKTSVTCLCFANGDRSLLALGCADGSASIVNTTTSAVRLIPAPSKSSSVSDVAWSSGNEWLLVGRRQESTVLYEASSLRALRVFSQPCACVAFHPANDNLLLLAGPGGVVQFNASTGAALSQPVLKLSGRETATSCCWPSPDLLFVGSSEGRLFVISPSSRTVTVVRAGAPINSLSFHSWMLRRQSVRELLVSVPSATGKGASLLVYRLGVEMKVIASFRVPNKALRVRSRFCPLAPASRDGSCVVSGGENAELLVFDVCRFGKSRPLINALHGHTAPVLDVAWAFDETLLASSDLSGLVIVWKRKFV